MVSITEDRKIERSRLATTDQHWSWIHLAAADFDLTSSTLHEFLVWASRESGLKLRFDSDAAHLAAKHTRLHGNIKGLEPLEAIQAVLATTSFTTHDAAAHELVVDFKR